MATGGKETSESAGENINMEELINGLSQALRKSSSGGNANISIETFRGNPEDDANKWLEKIEAWVAFNGWTNEPEKVASALRLKLDGAALSWFRGLSSAIVGNTATLFDKFRHYFNTLHPTWMLEQQLYDRTMGSEENLESYITDVEARCKRLNKAEQEKTTAFIRGLNPSLRMFVIQKNPGSFREAVQSARLAKESMTMSNPTQTEVMRSIEQQGKAIADLTTVLCQMKDRNDPSVKRTRDVKCQLCSKNGHEAQECRQFSVSRREDKNRDRNKQCFKCLTYGHIARNCPGNQGK
ncbi:hypothetical protein FSP39_002406 [Pinctada imbricata]|uniref:CCHC-type domain-containing protein n=1 Tax=Pinctada imbricata TaxID=66713 RepID=A0AA88YVD9_PINIB|nr:hypothetical protein FSP39_002406 [Pinctada imbricata]